MVTTSTYERSVLVIVMPYDALMTENSTGNEDFNWTRWVQRCN